MSDDDPPFFRSMFWDAARWQASDSYARLAPVPHAALAYRNLIDACWLNQPAVGGDLSIPDDDSILAHRAGLSIDEWRAVRETVLACSPWQRVESRGAESLTRWKHRAVCGDYEKALRAWRLKVDHGRKGGQVRADALRKNVVSLERHLSDTQAIRKPYPFRSVPTDTATASTTLPSPSVPLNDTHRLVTEPQHVAHDAVDDGARAAQPQEGAQGDAAGAEGFLTREDAAAPASAPARGQAAPSHGKAIAPKHRDRKPAALDLFDSTLPRRLLHLWHYLVAMTTKADDVPPVPPALVALVNEAVKHYRPEQIACALVYCFEIPDTYYRDQRLRGIYTALDCGGFARNGQAREGHLHKLVDQGLDAPIHHLSYLALKGFGWLDYATATLKWKVAEYMKADK